MNKETTQIPVTKSTRQKLRNISIKGETYDESINKLIALKEKFEDERKLKNWFENNFEHFGFNKIKEKKRRDTPDYIMLKNGEEINVKIESISSNFFKKGHDSNDVDMVICLFVDQELPVETREIIDVLFEKEIPYTTEKETGVEKIFLLMKIARMNIGIESEGISKEKITKESEKDPNTVSRQLTELYEDGLIEKKPDNENGLWTLTSEGVRLLRSLWFNLRGVFGGLPEKIKLTGRVVSGLGEGSYYISKEGYQKQFRKKLGFEPYPGTLDLKLNTDSKTLKKWLELEKGIEIEGFSTKERSFGRVKCFHSKINGEEAAVVLPFRTHHEEDILEIISPLKIRDRFDLEDGDELEIEVEI